MTIDGGHPIRCRTTALPVDGVLAVGDDDNGPRNQMNGTMTYVDR